MASGTRVPALGYRGFELIDPGVNCVSWSALRRPELWFSGSAMQFVDREGAVRIDRQVITVTGDAAFTMPDQHRRLGRERNGRRPGSESSGAAADIGTSWRGSAGFYGRRGPAGGQQYGATV